MAAIALNTVGKSFGRTDVIRGVDLAIEDGEFVVFVGPSGCGKSTLLRLIAGLEDISQGQILFDGEPVDELTPSERGIAMVFQSYALYPHMNVYDNMAFGLKLAKVGRAGVEERVREAARVLQIEHLLARKPKELSGGQRQRVAIGRAIVRNPRAFLFDEPLSNLDASLRVQMRIEIARLHRDLGTTMIYVTHDQTEAMTLADRIVVLNGGRVEQFGRPLELYRHPRNLFVAGFIGSPRMNLLPATVDACTGNTVELHLAGGDRISVTVADTGGLRSGRNVTLGLRPEHLLAADADASGIGGEVVAVEHLGGESYVYLSRPDGDPLVIKTTGAGDIRNGQTLRVTARPGDAYLFDTDGQALPRGD